jgi:MraZ protein
MAQNRNIIITGSWRLPIDGRGRILLPATLRKRLADAGEPSELVLTKGHKHFISIYWPSQWEAKFEAAGRELSGGELYRWYSVIGPSAEQVPIDRAGHLQIPPELREYAMLERELVIAGKFRFLEGWEPKLFKVHLEEVQTGMNFEEINNKIMNSLSYCSAADGRTSPRPSRQSEGPEASESGVK